MLFEMVDLDDCLVVFGLYGFGFVCFFMMWLVFGLVMFPLLLVGNSVDYSLDMVEISFVLLIFA